MTGKMLKINPLITQLLLIRRKSRELQPKFRHGILACINHQLCVIPQLVLKDVS